MSENPETIYTDKRGRMRLTVIRKIGRYGPQYSVIVKRSYKVGEDDNGNPRFEDTYWLDERDVLPSKKLHDIADDVIAERKRIDAQDNRQKAA